MPCQGMYQLVGALGLKLSYFSQVDTLDIKFKYLQQLTVYLTLTQSQQGASLVELFLYVSTFLIGPILM